MTCPASWDYAYGGHLTGGDTLKKRQLSPILSNGRAWGAAAAAFHATGSSYEAIKALHDSIKADYIAQLERGFKPTADQLVDQQEKMLGVLEDYVSTIDALPNLTRLEGEINVPMLSRAGAIRKSSVYRFQCYIDGWTINWEGHQWIVEFKFRGELQDPELIQLSRQPRWYAWALREVMRKQGKDEHLVGVLYEERLAEAPKLPKMVRGTKEYKGMQVPSTDKRQKTTPALYEAACKEIGVPPDQELMLHLGQRLWQLRTPIVFRPGELDEAGDELVSAAKLIRDLDSNELLPIRNAKSINCRGCEFKQICANPRDTLYVDTMFVRGLPKRDSKRSKEIAA